MIFSAVTMICCVLLILFTSIILYHCLKEVEIIEKNLKYLQIQIDEVKEGKTEEE